MPTSFQHVYLGAAGYFLPGPPIDNPGMDAFVGPLGRQSARIKQHILSQNGIRTRHYALDEAGRTRWSHAALGAEATRDCLRRAGKSFGEVSFLVTATSGGDALMPGAANMLLGELGEKPIATASHHGICASGLSALEHAACALELGAHEHALVTAAEFPSRLFRRARFERRSGETDFGAHFLRWMLSDGAGSWLLSRQPGAGAGPGLRLCWVHTKSFSGDYPVCMQLGLDEGGHKSHLDFATEAEAEAQGAFSLRQDIRLLPQLFEVCIHEYVELVKQGWVDPGRIDHFLCHYSSEKFAPVVEELLDKAQLSIPRQRWFSNLSTRGNTGAASIFIMLAEFLETRRLRPGQRILCFVPESGRLSAGYLLFEVVDEGRGPVAVGEPVPAPHDPEAGPPSLRPLLLELAGIWQDYRSSVWRTPLVRRIVRGEISVDDYRAWAAQWVPQVREGSRWMREAIAHLSPRYSALAGLIETHAGEEQEDFRILYRDYLQAGGTASLDQLRRNPGGEALNAYLHALARDTDAIGLLGATYVIEGTGQRIINPLLPLLRRALPLGPEAFRFLEYHSQNDENHLARWLNACELVLAVDPGRATDIVREARRTSQLYLLQFEHILVP